MVPGGVGAAPARARTSGTGYGPHRLQYIRSANAEPGSPRSPPARSAGCRACPSRSRSSCTEAASRSWCSTSTPYNSGHLLVCPYRHVADYTQLDAAEIDEVADLTQRSMVALRAAAGPQGFNIGMNQGKIAGAGVADHLHQHVVPRWRGDINFMPIVGGTKTMPMLLEQTRDLSRVLACLSCPLAPARPTAGMGTLG